MMDLPIASSAEANSLQYSPNTPKIPERGTAIRMVLVPIPIDSPVNPVEADPPAEKPESNKTESGSNTANQPAVKPASPSTLDPPTSKCYPKRRAISWVFHHKMKAGKTQEQSWLDQTRGLATDPERSQ